MEAGEQEVGEEASEELTVDLSKQSLKKIERATNDVKTAKSLILDQNMIHKLENLETYPNLLRLSASGNQLFRMCGVSQLLNLTVLDLSNNSINLIEGLKGLKLLKQLILSGNKVKTLDYLHMNLQLELVDLSDNLITHISDISFLDKLKELLLHNNRLSHLRQCEKHLPVNLETLTLSNNNITDLNEISHLVNLTKLMHLAIKGNPCLETIVDRIGFAYRPYIKNWCGSLMTVDNFPLDDIECLRAEWLFSQGKGRSFHIGEHAALIEYLSSVYPNSENEDERKLRLILSKAQLHQQELQQQTLNGSMNIPVRHKLPFNKKKMSGLAERMVSSCHDSLSKDSSRGSPDLMTRSLDAAILRNSPPPVHHVPKPTNHIDTMRHSPLQTATTLVPVPESLTSPDVCRPLHPLLAPNPSRKPHPMATSSPKVSPYSTPESKRRLQTGVLRSRNMNSPSPVSGRKSGDRTEVPGSPKLGRSTSASSIASPKKPTPFVKRDIPRRNPSHDKETSEEEDSEMSASKLQAIQQRANQKRSRRHENVGNQLDNKQVESAEREGKENAKRGKRTQEETDEKTDLWRAAVCIQRRWRGYRTRNLNADVVSAYKEIQTNRIQDYIMCVLRDTGCQIMCIRWCLGFCRKVANDMEATKVALEGNRKLQMLQMQAINALWKKMTAMGSEGEGTSADSSRDTLQGLAATCCVLNKQVEELQNMMRVMQHAPPGDHGVATATQTEIIAVHTPQGDGKERFPYHPQLERLERPNNLALTQAGPESVEQFATSLATDVIKSISSGPDSCSDSNDVVMSLDDNSNFREASLRDESICLTPACQEGKDLRGCAVRVVTPPVAEGVTDSTSDHTPVKESPQPNKSDDYHNGCPSS